jgi:hypothetical protein
MSRYLVLILISLSLLALSSEDSQAMRYEGTVLRAGAGFMFSDAQYSFNGADRIDGDTQIGATAGVQTLWRMSRKSPWMIVLGLDWVQRGYSGVRQLPDVDPLPVKVDVLAEFISVPVLGRVHFVEDKLSAYAIFGASLEFRIRHDDDELLNEGKDFALGGNVGIGFEYELGRRTALVLEGKYHLDFTDSWDGGDLYTVNSHRYQAAVVTGGVRF